MKTQLSALDIYILTRELKNLILAPYTRIQKIYNFNERRLKLKIHSQKNKIKLELILTPNYFCISKYSHSTSLKPSSFVMQLRKYLENSVVKEIKQNNFDRVIEFTLENKGERFLLIVELFSEGNIIFCNEKDKKIIGLLEQQKWKSRNLVVGEIYKKPPIPKNPLEIKFSDFEKILKNSEKNLVSTLAMNLNLSSNYSEEICFSSGIKKDKNCKELSDEEIKKIFNSFSELMEKIKKEKIKASIVMEKNKMMIDVIPFDFSIYQNFEKKYFSSFNDAVDEYFFHFEKIKSEIKIEKKFDTEFKKLEKIREEQLATIKNLEEKEMENKEIADIIYQNFSAIEKVLKLVKETKNKESLIGTKIDGIKIKGIEKTSVIIEL